MNDPMGGQQAVGVEDRGGRHLGDPVRDIDLAREAQELREDETWQREGHNAKTLVKNDSLRIVLIHMQEGARLGEHQTDSRIAIQVLTGKVSVRLPGGSHAVAAAQLLAVDASLPHDVEALEPSTFLLTLARVTRDAAAGREAH